ncbi:division/cell wall cluster transcriptional repressor MraZ [Candidatus Daviesbacteria bacterium RIFCSPHIGHO2_12_FULL_37_11]|uniref:Transcriptional regulator MraZ n=1 Tax=Candidatus Daviesbacteria bacterium RIFCSPHIGHO2_12_FULL_37_11 TaxID=1797777 RepID=A0A1F5KBZ0_9BACT|nr:MAG: division/cell wall cluster transcriptional repressor MraZ [Candidatus Daviesbacteria bacterium GWA1_38_6]OGE16983.1 MAG: division/cell wall cluster transcriptional repressor MraZ [Candidatus Daviesbacteria bacterium RIFCSPHIGHO2_01_FULL_37_27]OGE38285.1 MAG: division/cell wall cluster transcriptional repressor MraZ [Candidatus Daviesbacteria bacterium RIFCSPHIGHO2_12_FULL_37_11]OGE46241.1 MAG: division/cell wall cluster transcriptional repressor MraZ [Candidatus Daviesbacteria bacterium 
MFLGEYKLKFTGIGRVILPKKIRMELTSEVIILSRGFEGCVWGFDEKTFEKEARRQLEISATEERARMLRRYLFSGSEPAELDSQGRFVIPSALLTHGKLFKEVIIIGAGDHFEIWDTKTWNKYLKKLEEEYLHGRIS